MKKLFLAAMLCGASLAVGFAIQTAAAQPTPKRVRVAAPSAASAEPAPVDSAILVAAIRKVLAENYVLPDKRGPLDAALARGLAEGRYNVADRAQLVQRINEDLEAVAHDKHLGLQFAPDQAAQLAGGRQRDDGPPSPQQQALAQRRNHGVSELKLFPGNIRYLDLRGFVWVGPKSAEAYDNAARFLRDGDAVIIDLRRNGGGSPDAVQYLISHFLEPNKPIVTFHMGASQVDRLSSLAELPAGRMVGKPLYVLTSGTTASAAEEFTGHVAGFRIGEVIGDTTAGAGFRNEFFALPGGYVISVSVGRAVLAATGKDWEGVGIKPTMAIAEAKALYAARMHAMRRLAASATDPRVKGEIEAMSALLAAKLEPVTPALPLAGYAGAFGERVIKLEGGKLIYQRAGGGPLTLVALGPNIFTFEEDPMARVIFSVAGNQASGFELIRGDGSRVPVQRSN